MKLSEMSMDDLVDRETGQAIISLGQGEQFRDIIWEIINNTLKWKRAKLAEVENCNAQP
jgi:hypothetical protein